MLGTPAVAYSRGMAAIMLVVVAVMGVVPLYFIGERARKIGVPHGFVTQAQCLSHIFDSRALSLILVLITIVFSVPYLALQIKGAGLILNVVSNNAIPIWLGALLTYGIVVSYVIVSGVTGVGLTNAFQGMFMMVTIGFLGFYFPYQYHGGVTNMFSSIAASDKSVLLSGIGLGAGGVPWSQWEFYSTIVVLICGFSCWPHLFMKAFAANSNKSLKKVIVLIPLFGLFLVPLMFIGFASINIHTDLESADQLVPRLLVDSGLPILLVGLFCAATLAASDVVRRHGFALNGFHRNS